MAYAELFNKLIFFYGFKNQTVYSLSLVGTISGVRPNTSLNIQLVLSALGGSFSGTFSNQPVSINFPFTSQNPIVVYFNGVSPVTQNVTIPVQFNVPYDTSASIEFLIDSQVVLTVPFTTWSEPISNTYMTNFTGSSQIPLYIGNSPLTPVTTTTVASQGGAGSVALCVSEGGLFSSIQIMGNSSNVIPAIPLGTNVVTFLTTTQLARDVSFNLVTSSNPTLTFTFMSAGNIIINTPTQTTLPNVTANLRDFLGYRKFCLVVTKISGNNLNFKFYIDFNLVTNWTNTQSTYTGDILALTSKAATGILPIPVELTPTEMASYYSSTSTSLQSNKRFNYKAVLHGFTYGLCPDLYPSSPFKFQTSNFTINYPAVETEALGSPSPSVVSVNYPDAPYFTKAFSFDGNQYFQTSAAVTSVLTIIAFIKRTDPNRREALYDHQQSRLLFNGTNSIIYIKSSSFYYNFQYPVGFDHNQPLEIFLGANSTSLFVNGIEFNASSVTFASSNPDVSYFGRTPVTGLPITALNFLGEIIFLGFMPSTGLNTVRRVYSINDHPSANRMTTLQMLGLTRTTHLVVPNEPWNVVTPRILSNADTNLDLSVNASLNNTVNATGSVTTIPTVTGSLTYQDNAGVFNGSTNIAYALTGSNIFNKIVSSTSVMLKFSKPVIDQLMIICSWSYGSPLSYILAYNNTSSSYTRPGLLFGFRSTTQYQIFSYIPDNLIPFGQWFNLTVVNLNSPLNNPSHMCLNGKLGEHCSTVYSNLSGTGTSIFNNAVTPTIFTNLGGLPAGVTVGNSFSPVVLSKYQGLMKNFKAYNRQLSHVEIRQLSGQSPQVGDGGVFVTI
jgi:hypothetical protein